MTHRLTDIFDGRSVFVTGHTGFKGSWLCMWLEHLGARVTGYALAPPTEPSNFVVSDVRAHLANHHEADIRDAERVRKAMVAAKPDVVLHLAAQSIVRRGYKSPRETFETNLMGTVNVLDAVRYVDQPCAVVAVTSDKCYENKEQVWGYTEKDALGESDPYGASKGAAEIAIRSYRQSFFSPERVAEHGVKLASARAGNVLGGGDWTNDALIVDVVAALATNQPVLIRSPHANRPWQHVLQALSGYLTLAGRLLESDSAQFCGAWNFGPLPGNELPVHQIVDRFIAEWGSGSWQDISDHQHPHESKILRLAVDKALWELDWKPCWRVERTICETAKWYRRYFEDSRDMRAYSLSQITMYEAEHRFENGETPVEQETVPVTSFGG